MKTISEFLTTLPAASKALSALFGALCVGVLVGALGVREIPAQIAANTEAIKENTTLIVEHADSDGHQGVDDLRRDLEAALTQRIRQDSTILAEVRRTNCYLSNATEGRTIPAAIRECGL